MKVDVDQIVKSGFDEVEFFVLGWSDSAFPIDFIGDCAGVHIDKNENYFFITSKSRQSDRALCHKVDGDSTILFRGYDLDLGLHTYSEKDKLLHTLKHESLGNGVFVYISASDNRLKVKSDPFGVSPVYYQKSNGVYLFSSHPTLIVLEKNRPDYYSWLSLIQNDFIFGDRSFYENIQRIAPGSEVIIDCAGENVNRWFDLNSLPQGVDSVDEASFGLVEEACQQSIDKCLDLGIGNITLPFSSGYDSRRFFASFQNRGVIFKALTCQSYQHKNGKFYDIDGTFAPKIGGFFGVDVEVIKATKASDLEKDYQDRMQFIGTETFMHGWSLPLIRRMRSLDESIVFDGLGGDTLGNGGFEYEGLHASNEKDKTIILEETVNNKVFKFVSKLWPSKGEYVREYQSEMDRFPSTPNGIELVFLLFRTRRSISPWITMMQPPGDVVVFPYLDVGFAKACLRYSPVEKYSWFFQKECLKRFWPRYYDFEGSRNLPVDMRSIPGLEIASIGRAKRIFAVLSSSASMRENLKFLNKVIWQSLSMLKLTKTPRSWFYEKLLMLVKCEESKKVFVSL